MHEARLQLPCTDLESAQAAMAALRVELADGPSGSTASLELAHEPLALELTIAAPDVSTLRAALSGAVRLLDTALVVTGNVPEAPESSKNNG